MVGSMYQAETPSGLSKYKENEKGKIPTFMHPHFQHVPNIKAFLGSFESSMQCMRTMTSCYGILSAFRKARWWNS